MELENVPVVELDMLGLREKIMKCKLIALDSMDKHPLINPKYMNRLDKEKLMKKIKELMDELSEEEITSRFNEICVDKLFCCGADVSNYPVYVDPRTISTQKDALKE